MRHVQHFVVARGVADLDLLAHGIQPRIREHDLVAEGSERIAILGQRNESWRQLARLMQAANQLQSVSAYPGREPPRVNDAAGSP